MAKNYFYFKVPFRSDFSLNEGVILEKQSKYSEFWQQIKASGINQLAEGKEIQVQYMHSSLNENDLQFESVDKDSSLLSGFSPMVLQIKPLDWFEAEIRKESGRHYEAVFGTQQPQRLDYVDASCRISLYKNTMSTIEFIFSLDMKNGDIDRTSIGQLEQWSNDFSAYFAAYAYSEIMLPFLDELRKRGKEYGFFHPAGKNEGFPDICSPDKKDSLIKASIKCGLPLWVSRSLIIGERDKDFEELVNRWLITTGSKEEITERFNSEDNDEKNRVYLGWMHSMMTGNINDKVIKDAFFALGLAQYYYTIFDSLNQNLSQIIGISREKRSMKETREYKKRLEEMVFTTDLIKINFADITQGLQRNRAYFFNILVEQWTIDNIMENVRKKIVLCKDNIQKIYQVAFNRSQKMAEWLLFFISGIAILEFLKELSAFFYGPESLSHDIWGLYNIAQLVGPNSMMWIGIIFFLLISIIYIRLLKNKD